jgi:hypothetical protein
LLTSFLTTSFFNILTSYFDFFGGVKVNRTLVSHSDLISNLILTTKKISSMLLDLNQRMSLQEDYSEITEESIHNINMNCKKLQKIIGKKT